MLLAHTMMEHQPSQLIKRTNEAGDGMSVGCQRKHNPNKKQHSHINDQGRDGLTIVDQHENHIILHDEYP